MTIAAFLLGLLVGVLLKWRLSAPSDELTHLRECRALGWITQDELTRLEALEHG